MGDQLTIRHHALPPPAFVVVPIAVSGEGRDVWTVMRSNGKRISTARHWTITDAEVVLRGLLCGFSHPAQYRWRT